MIQQVTDTVMSAVREAWAHRRVGGVALPASPEPAAPPDVIKAPTEARPKVGAWQQLKEYDGAERLYDDRGQLVGGYDPRSIPGCDWFAVRPLLFAATGTAATPSLARCAILEVLKTWADVSAVETE